jgi:O-antigen/teichoic acid export membrane protein
VKRWLGLLRGARGKGLGGQLARGVAGSFAVTMAATGLRLAAAVVLARALGVEGLGIYVFAVSVMTLLAIPSEAGLPTLVVREVAAAQATGRWGLLRGMLRWSNGAVLLISAAVALLAGGALLLLGGGLDEPTRLTLQWALFLIPLASLGAVRGATLRGLRHVVLAQLPDGVIRPLVLIGLVAGAWLASGAMLRPEEAILYQVAAAAIGFAIGVGFLLRRVPEAARSAAPEYAGRAWLGSMGPLVLLAGIQVVNDQIDFVLLRILAGTEEVGLYRVAWNAAALVALPLGIVNAVVAPHIARLWAQGDKARLQRMLVSAARVVLVLSLPVALALGSFGRPILALAFGEEFTDAWGVLAVLAAGQLIHTASGSTGIVMNMTGHERTTMLAVGVAAAVHLGLSAALIPHWGAVGAAVGGAAALAAWNAILLAAIRRKLGVRVTAFNC